jgi:CRP/FNR family transcriptional regulator
MLFTEGARSTSVGVVESGTLRVFTSSVDGAETTLTVIHPGEMFGELGVLDDMPRSASVAALRRSELVEVPAAAFRSAYDTDPAIARQIVTLLVGHMRRISDGLVDLTYLDLGARFAKYVLKEAHRQGRSEITLPLTQAELGQLLGGARQTVNQVARSLERVGLIEVNGRTVRIIDEDGLRFRATSST